LNSALLTVRFVLAFILLLAAVPKAADGRRFRRSVADYRLLPSRLEGPAARAIPWIEVASSVALISGVALAPVAAIDGLLFLAFSIAVSLNLRRGRSIDCGCFGAAERRAIGWDLVATDLVCAAMAGTIAITFARPSIAGDAAAVQRAPLASSSSVAPALLAGTLVVAYLLMVSWLAFRAALPNLPPHVRGDLG
jgi:hypothetical protein